MIAASETRRTSMADTRVADELAIRGLIERYSDAVCRHDAATIETLWSDEARWSVPDMPALADIRGKEAIMAAFRAAQEFYPFTFLICVPGFIDIAQDRATARSYTTEIIRDRDGNTRRAAGVYEDVFAKRDGRWLFTERVWRLLDAA
jgi:ketosteroid isomerase-like protein